MIDTDILLDIQVYENVIHIQTLNHTCIYVNKLSLQPGTFPWTEGHIMDVTGYQECRRRVFSD